MSPVSYIERTRGKYSAKGFPPYQWTVTETVPWTPLAKPLEKCRLAVISSGGIYHKDQPAFNPDRDDLTFRELPKDVDVRDLRISHNHYDHTDAEKDVNCVFPIQRLLELEAEGFIGELAPINYTFMGAIFRRTTLMRELAPTLARLLKERAVDLFYLVPA